jgi:23S rRNA (uridine2552-2'-O)-methyltransferase
VGRVLAIDLQEVEPIAGAEIHQLDFLVRGRGRKVKEWLGGKADVVMSDMAAASRAQADRSPAHRGLVRGGAQFAFDVLEPGGTFVAKVLAGGAEGGLQTLLKQRFDTVANVKPQASRADSSEKFVVARGFRG